MVLGSFLFFLIEIVMEVIVGCKVVRKNTEIPGAFLAHI